MVVAVFALTIAGCGGNLRNNSNDIVTPDGDSEVRELTFEPFNAIDINGVFNVVYRQSNDYRIELEIEDNLWDITEVRVVNSTLQINFTRAVDFSDRDTPNLYIYAPTLTAATFGGIITASNWDDIQADTFILTSDGVTTLEISGQANATEFNINGISNVNALDFQTRTAVVNIHDISELSVSASDELEVSISDLSTVAYRGNPTVTEIYVAIMATLRQMN